MAINFESAIGIHEDALRFRAKRASVLANNLANVNTPNYKARDMDFQSLLENQVNSTGKPLKLDTTHGSHHDAKGFLGDESGLMYRNPEQPSIDGNTVEEHVEHAKFMENSLDFQTSFLLLNSKFKGLKTALKGQ